MRDASDSDDDLQPAADGVGALLQRDYWAVIRNCSRSPSEVMTFVRERFLDLPPDELVAFEHPNGQEKYLEAGDELDVIVRMMDPVRVRVIHADACSLTLGTLKGHPEAGRITFGAYRNDRDDVIFHIRSRARSGSLLDYAGFHTAGDPMQTNTWTDYIDQLAHQVGDGVVHAIHAEQEEADEVEADATMDAPTFIARGD